MATNKPSDQVTTPVGRLVMGNLYEPRTTDMEGRPLVFKTGTKQGQPRADFFFAVAIPKGAEVSQPHQHLNWIHTTWGAAIYQAGASFLAHAASLPTFAWKVQDGDSTVPNKAGNILSQREGCKGCWVLFFAGTVPPRLCNADGSQQLTEPGAIKPGYYVQVCFTAVGNGSPQQPGVYLNPHAVALAGYGQEIFFGIDTKGVGFGQGVQLPAGASATPLAQLNAPVMALPGASAAPLPGASAAMVPAGLPGVATVAMPALPAAMQPQVAPPMPAAIAMGQVGSIQPPTSAPALAQPAAPALPNVQPNAAFLQPQVAQPQLTPAAQQAGYTLQQLLTTYTLDQLKQAGYVQ